MTEANGWPAFTPVLLRTPGSVWANAIPGKNNATKNTRTEASFIVFIPGLLRLGSTLSLLLGVLPDSHRPSNWGKSRRLGVIARRDVYRLFLSIFAAWRLQEEVISIFGLSLAFRVVVLFTVARRSLSKASFKCSDETGSVRISNGVCNFFHAHVAVR